MSAPSPRPQRPARPGSGCGVIRRTSYLIESLPTQPRLSSQQMLSAFHEDLGAGDIAEISAAELEDDARHLLGRAQAVERDARDEAVIFRTHHRRLDLAGCNGVDAHAELGELDGHLPRERREGRLRGGIGRAGEGMDGVAGDRGDVDDGPLALGEGGREAASEGEGREEIELVDMAPGGEIAVET